MKDVLSLNKKIELLQLKIQEIDNLLNARPIEEILKIREETSNLFMEYPTVQSQRENSEFTEKYLELWRREDEQLKIIEKSNSVTLIKNKVHYQFQIDSINQDLYYLNLKKNKWKTQ